MMIQNRSCLLVPLAFLLFACGEKADPPGDSNGGSGGTGSGGSATGGSAGSSGSSSVSCTITASASLSERIPTVGIVTFTTDLAGMTGARIEFGRDTSYGMTAPVDLDDDRTLLLGMKPATEYHYRVVATGPSGSCAGPDQTITTGARPNGLPTLELTTATAASLSGGFLLTGQYLGSAGAGAPAYIIDADGDIVWWFITGQANVTSARMSYDGKHMWIQNANVPESQGAEVHRVSMDGMTDEDLTSDFTGANHQFTVLPDETVVFYAYSEAGCDDIKERLPDGTVRTIVNAGEAQGIDEPCHVNHIEYSPEDDTLVFSDLDHDSFTKIRRDGEVVWVIGGPASDFTGDAQTWSRQHGVDMIGLDRFVFFNNGAMGSASGSLAIEILLDLDAMTASRPWTYTATPSIANLVMGDVQRMDNGNTIVAYSTQGVVHEVDEEGRLLQEVNWPLGGAFGYIVKRPTLYGPPSR
ncbi:MAG TPA: arylsulfotransferase family protein [Polyangiaceae bacterium]